MNGMLCSGNTLQLPAGHSYNRLYILAAAQLLKKMLEAYSRQGRICRRLSFLLIPVSSDNGGIQAIHKAI
jgi:hypothetical protein